MSRSNPLEALFSGMFGNKSEEVFIGTATPEIVEAMTQTEDQWCALMTEYEREQEELAAKFNARKELEFEPNCRAAWKMVYDQFNVAEEFRTEDTNYRIHKETHEIYRIVG